MTSAPGAASDSPVTDPSPFADYLRARDLMLGLIRSDRHADDSPRAVRLRQPDRLGRFERFMAHIGRPQDRLRVVHVTGTSGKGSTSTMIAAMLQTAGYRVGLITSPYLQVATEKIQVDGQLIDGRAYLREVEEVLEAGRDWSRAEGDPDSLTYAQCGTAVGLRHLAGAEVDIAVIEVAAGGRFDLSNVVRPEVSVITTVGPDHLVSLGPTLADVAWHKAGIIKPGVDVVTGVTDPDLLGVIERQAHEVGARLAARPSLHVAHTKMEGGFQRENARTAVAVIEALRRRGFDVPETAVVDGLGNARLPGRFERLRGGDTAQIPVLLDGAHNPEKMAALVDSFANLGEGDASPLPVVVLGLLGSKDDATIVRELLPAASALVLTEPQVFGKAARPAHGIAATARSLGFSGPVEVAPEPLEALDAGLEVARRANAPLVVTGSLYLVGSIRERWYPGSEIVLQRTPWPQAERPLVRGC